MRHVPLFALVLCSMSAACSGRIHDPNAFLDPGAACNLQDPYEELIKPRCATSGCHATAAPISGLDLEAKDAPQKLVAAPAQGCSNQVLVSATTSGGYLLEKLDERPDCGRQMPLTGNPLTAEERACVAKWLQGGAR